MKSKKYLRYGLTVLFLITFIYLIYKERKIINLEFIGLNFIFTGIFCLVFYIMMQNSKKFRVKIRRLLLEKESKKEKKIEIEELQEIVIKYYLQKRELETAKEMAETQAKTKEIFLQNMSHEIRTPLNGIVAMIEMLKYTELNEKQKKYLDKIIKVSNTLVGVINNILDYSKIQSEKILINKGKFNIRELIMELKTFFISGVRDDIFVIFLISEDIPEILIGDSFRIKQVLINIIGNAFKFTQQGVIKVEILCREIKENMGVFEFIISDTGIGIPEEKIEELFKSFMQADESISRRYGGTGLGLAISKEIIAIMEGSIKVTSEVKKGSVFSIEIPLEIYKERTKQELNNATVVIVEENREICTILLKMFSQYNMNSYICDNLDELNDILEENSENIVIIARSKFLEKNSKIYNCILSNENIKNKTLLMKEYNFTNENLNLFNYVEYPIEQEEIICKINNVLGNKYFGSLYEKPEEIIPEINKKIAIIEDNEINADAMVEMLEKLGAEVSLFRNGIEALRELKEKKYDLIISDIQLPDLSGVELLKLLREYDTVRGENRKIVALTAHAMEGYREKCLRAGFDDYISKPVTMNQLYNIIVLNTGEQIDLDAKKIENLKTINEEIVRKLRNELKKSALTSFSIIKKFIDEKEYESALFEIHKLKGSFGNARESELYRKFVSFEENLKNRSGDLYSEYESCFNLFKERFQNEDYDGGR